MSETILDKTYESAAKLAAAEFDYGYTIKKEWLIEQFLIKKPDFGTENDFNLFSFEFLQNFEKFRELMLKDYKKALRCVRGVGYEVIPPPEQTDYAMDNMRKDVSKTIKKAIDHLTHINEELLTLDDMKKRDESIGKLAALSAFSKHRLEILR